MAEQKQPRGECAFCGYVSTRAVLTKHLTKCPQREAMNREATGSTRTAETLWHLQIRDAYISDFWLNLEISGSATLKKLDSYLRAIWLECCGHLSQFSIGGWQGRKIGMNQKIDDVFQPALELTHIYDFGTSSTTLVKAISTRVGVPLSKHPIFLMARNQIPAALCIDCGKPATYLCMECMMEGEWNTFCKEHAQSHPHAEEEELILLVNSPRLGMCGYTGPADPPY